MFPEEEVQYLKSQKLARLATVSSKGQPDVVPVAYEFDGRYFWIGSNTQDILIRTMKYKNVNSGNNKVALVIDDLESLDPWRPRQIKIYGVAEVVYHKGNFGIGKYIRIVPRVSWSIGVRAPVEGYSQVSRGNREWRTRTIHRQTG
jgi:pyridoxamine 5'-phosphate oxidase family protein